MKKKDKRNYAYSLLLVIGFIIAFIYLYSEPKLSEPKTVEIVTRSQTVEKRKKINLKSLTQLIGKIEKAKIEESLKNKKKTEKKISLQDALLNDEYCEIIKQGLISQYNISEIYQILSKTNSEFTDYIPNINAIDTLMGALHESNPEKLADDQEPILLYFNALYNANMISGLTNPQPDIDRAIFLLEWAKEIDSNNAAYPFYLAALKDQANYPEYEVVDELYDSFESENFNGHIQEVVRAIYSRGLKDESHMLVARTLTHSIPVNDVMPLVKVLKKYLSKQDDSFAVSAKGLVISLRKSGDLYSDRYEPFTYWSELEYSLGRLVDNAINSIITSNNVSVLRNYDEPYNKYFDRPIFKKLELESGDNGCPSQEIRQAIIDKRREEFRSFYAESP